MTQARRLMAGMAVALAAASISSTAHAVSTLPTGWSDQTLVSGLTKPTAVAWAPDGRMFVASKDGRVQVVSAAGVLNPVPIIVLTHVNSNTDRGLLGIAVDSDYANPNGTHRFLYLLYTYDANPADSSGPKVSQLVRVVVNPDNSVVGSPTPILGTNTTTPCPTPSNTLDCIPSDSPSHSIGTVRSDPADGTLWVGSGDGADFNTVDPTALRTYNEATPAGKIMHIDRNGNGLTGHPFCPSDANLSHVCTKLYAKGFRNPFRFTLRPGTGPFVGDVGWNTWEELDLVQAGKDYGWPCWEGNVQTSGYDALSGCSGPGGEYSSSAQPPDYAYIHTGAGGAVIAGPTYTGTDYPAGFRGTIFFGDYAQGFLKRWDPATQTAVPFGSDTLAWVDLESAPAGLSYANPGDLIYVSIGATFAIGQGTVGRVSYTSGNHPPVARASGTPTSGNAPLNVSFKGDTSSDPDGDPPAYDWNFGDGSAHSSAANPSHTYASGSYTATLTVSDGRGLTGTATVPVVAGGPTATITAPVDQSLYRDGTSVALQGTATNPDGQPTPNATFSWHVILHHNTHTHDIGLFSGSSTSFSTRTDHDADSYYDITLTVTDPANGLTDSKTVSVLPQAVAFTLDSTPGGAPVSYSGVAATAPSTTNSAIGYVTSISAGTSFTSGGTSYVFESWSDGGARLHNVTIPASAQTLTARYDGVPTARIAPSAPSGVSPLNVSFDGTGSTDPGDALTYDWDFGDGSAHSTASKPSHTYARGNYTATLTVNDGRGGSNTTTVPVTATNAAPTARATSSPSPATGTGPLSVSFDGTTSSDPENDTLTYDWNFGDGSAHSTAAKPSHTYARGSYTATLTVNDGNGGTNSTTVSITATNANPTARVTPTSASGAAPLAVDFNGGSSTDPNGDALTYAWDFGDGATQAASSSPTATHQYARGSYTATLTVDDSHGKTGTATIPVTATNAKPTARATADHTSGSAPLAVAFDGTTSSDPEGDTVTYAWDFGDGATQAASSSPTASHTYARGNYTATLTVDDQHGGTDSTTLQINAGNSAPVARATADRTTGTAPLQISFDGTGSGDADGDALTYDWDFGDGSAHSNAAKPTHTFSGGARTVRLTVDDGHGATGSATVDVNVSPTPVSSPAEPSPGPSQNPVGGAGNPGSPSDRSGPDLRVAGLATGLRRGRLRGSVTDPSGIRVVEVAVRARRPGGKPCQWWSWRRRALRKPASCSSPAWIRAGVTGKSWSAWLGRALPRGSYVVLVRATDRRGHRKTELMSVVLT